MATPQDDLCTCGSGKPYEFCCRSAHDESRETVDGSLEELSGWEDQLWGMDDEELDELWNSEGVEEALLYGGFELEHFAELLEAGRLLDHLRYPWARFDRIAWDGKRKDILAGIPYDDRLAVLSSLLVPELATPAFQDRLMEALVDLLEQPIPPRAAATIREAVACIEDGRACGFPPEEIAVYPLIFVAQLREWVERRDELERRFRILADAVHGVGSTGAVSMEILSRLAAHHPILTLDEVLHFRRRFETIGREFDMGQRTAVSCFATLLEGRLGTDLLETIPGRLDDSAAGIFRAAPVSLLRAICDEPAPPIRLRKGEEPFHPDLLDITVSTAMLKRYVRFLSERGEEKASLRAQAVADAHVEISELDLLTDLP